MAGIDYSSLCLNFSNRANPKLQLEASNQLYSLLWSKQANLQTVLDNLLIYGINNSNEDISIGAIRHLPIILLKHFKDHNLNLTNLIRSLLKKNTQDVNKLFQNLELFLGPALFRIQKADAERLLINQKSGGKNHSFRQPQHEAVEKLLINLTDANLEIRKNAAKRLLELLTIKKLRHEDAIKSAKLMTADSNYEIRHMGANILLTLAGQACHTKIFLETLIRSSSKERNVDIKSIYNQSAVKLAEHKTSETVAQEMSNILSRSKINSAQNEEISNLLTILLLKNPTIDLAIDVCPALPLILNDYSQRAVQSGIELCAVVGSILINSEPLLQTLEHIERPEGSDYLKNAIIERIRKNTVPCVDNNAILIYGEKSKQEATPRKGSAGRTRSKFFPNGWTTDGQCSHQGSSTKTLLNNSPSKESFQHVPHPPHSQREVQVSKQTEEKLSKSRDAEPVQNREPVTAPRQREPDFLSSSLPSSFFKKKTSLKEGTRDSVILRRPAIPKSASRSKKAPTSKSGYPAEPSASDEVPKVDVAICSNDSPRKLSPLKQNTKYSADFDLLNTFGPDTNPNNYSANQVFQSMSTTARDKKDRLIDVEDNNNKALVEDTLSDDAYGLESLGSIRRSAKKRKMQKNIDRRTNSLDFNIQAVGKSLSSELKSIKIAESSQFGSNNRNRSTRPNNSYSERYTMGQSLNPSLNHRPASLPDFQPDHYQKSAFSLEIKAAEPPTRSQRQISPAKSAPVSVPASVQSDAKEILEPLRKPKQDMDQAIDRLNNATKTRWEDLIDAIQTTRKLAMHHQDVIGPRAAEITSLIVRQCQNGRSKVARFAFEGLKDLYRYLRKALVGQLDSALKVLLIECGKENFFLREKAEKCLDEIVEVLCAENCGHKVLLSLYQHKNSKNNSIRTMTARYLHLAVEKIGLGRALSDIKDITDKIIQFTSAAYQDPSSDVRFWGKKMIILLSNHPDFEKLCHRHLNSPDARSLIESAHNLSIKGLQKPESARRGSISRSVSGKQKNTYGIHETAKRSANAENSLRDDLKAVKATNATNASKLMALQSVRDHLESSRPLGSELTNATDLICNLIRSGVTGNSLEALLLAPLIVSHVSSEPILLPTLLQAAAERMNSSGKTQTAALNLIDSIYEEGDKSLLVAPIANRIQIVSVGRPRLAEIFCDICIELSDSKPKLVLKYGLKTLWSILRDHRCRQQSSVLSEVVYSLMGDKLFPEARKENLENELHQSLNLL